MNEIEPQLIFLDNAVNPAVTAPADRTTCVLTGTAISHSHQQIHDEAFEKGRGCRFDLIKKVVLKALPKLIMGLKARNSS